MAARCGLLWTIPVLGLALGGATAQPPAGPATSVWDGVYTGAQATSGAAVYREHCAACHGADLAGVEQAPALAGGTFGERWAGATLRRLVERVASMPPARPGSLSAEQYANVTAYLLRANGVPAGQAQLPADPRALDGIVFSARRPTAPAAGQAAIVTPAPARPGPGTTPVRTSATSFSSPS